MPLLYATALAVLVAAGEVGGASTEDWIQRGVLGLVVLGFVSGQIVPGWLYRSEKAERDRLTKVSEEKVLPALIAYNGLIQDQLKRVQG